MFWGCLKKHASLKHPRFFWLSRTNFCPHGHHTHIENEWSHDISCCSVTQSCLTLCDPMNHSTPGLPVHHQLLEFTQTHVHEVGDAIQPSHPLSSPSPPTFNLSQHQGLFWWISSSHQVAKVLTLYLYINVSPKLGDSHNINVCRVMLSGVLQDFGRHRNWTFSCMCGLMCSNDLETV